MTITEMIESLSEKTQNDIKYRILIDAAETGNIEVLKSIIQIIDPKINNSRALITAAKNGHTECVKLLIPISDLNEVGSEAHHWAWRWADENEQYDCLEALHDAIVKMKKKEKK